MSLALPPSGLIIETGEAIASEDDQATPSSSRSAGARIFVSSQQGLIELVAAFCPPVTLMRSLCLINKAVSSITSSRHSTTGNTLLQRYWYMLHYHLVWDVPEKDKAKRSLQFSLTKDNAKKNWQKKYKEELAAHLARTMRGAGCSNNHVNDAKNLSIVLVQSAPLLPDPCARQKVDLELVANVEALELREDTAFVQHCRDAGVHHDHFLEPASGGVSSLSRGEYRKDVRHGKRKGKHGKGGTSVWSEWDGTGNYEY